MCPDVKIEVTRSSEQQDFENPETTKRQFFVKRCYSEPTVFSDYLPTINFKAEIENHLSNPVLAFSSSILETTKSWTPFQWLKLVQILPTEEDISRDLEADESPHKFTEIDIASRTYFPLTFTVLLSLYFVMYIYIIEDETPLSLYN